MSDGRFTGERLHARDALFGVDLARHRAAYRFALDRATGSVVDLGSGSGYGATELAAGGLRVVGLDRVAPDVAHRGGRARFVRGDLGAVPLRGGSFDWALSFQVIEHLEDPRPYLSAAARLLRAQGAALVTTPNRLTSDGVNPFHVHEYVADELAAVLREHFETVEMLGVGASEAVARYLEERARRVARVLRLDPLRIRERLPRPLVEWLFGRFAILVRRGIQRGDGLPPVDASDFPIGPADDACLDLLAVCRGPRG